VAEGPARPAARVSLFGGATGGRIDAGTASRAGAFLAALRWLVCVVHCGAGATAFDEKRHHVKASGVDIVAAFDMSGSMISEDFVLGGQRVNRFDMARLF